MGCDSSGGHPVELPVGDLVRVRVRVRVKVRVMVRVSKG